MGIREGSLHDWLKLIWGLSKEIKQCEFLDQCLAEVALMEI